MYQRSFIGCIALYIVTVWIFRLTLKKDGDGIQSFFKLIKPNYIGCTHTLGQGPFIELCSLPFYNTARCYVISICLILAYFYYKCNCLLVKEIDEAERSFNSNKNVEEDDGDEGKIVTAYSQLN